MTQAQQSKETMSMLDSLERDALQGTKLKELSEKAEAVKRANASYLRDLETGTDQVFKGQERSQQEKSKLEQSIDKCKEFQTTVADSVTLVTGELAAVDQYLEGVEVYTRGERVANFLSRGKWGQQLKDKRVLSSSLSQNLTAILKYYGDMRDVMYSSAVEVKKAVNAIRAVRNHTLEKQNENETNYNEWQQTRTTLNAKLAAIDGELVSLTGDQRTQKETERASVRDQAQDALAKENDYFSIVDNARKDMQYQEQNLEQYESVVGGLAVAIRDMEQKIENRTVLFEKIEVLVKTAHRVRAASYSDAAMNKTMAGIGRTAVYTAEGILDSLGTRKKAEPMTPDEFTELKERGRAARAAWEAVQDESKAAYAQPGN